MGVMGPQLMSIAPPPKKLEEARKQILPLEAPEGTPLRSLTLVQWQLTGLYDQKILNLCSLKLPPLWCFVSAPVGKRRRAARARFPRACLKLAASHQNIVTNKKQAKKKVFFP